jgi:ribosomal protein S2
MKTETLNNKSQYKLLKFNLIKSKLLKKKHYLKAITLEDIEFRIKKALYIIYLYHINNKRILFVGNPLNINRELLKLFNKTKHIFIPKSAWIAGVITNQYSSFKSNFKQESQLNKISKQLLELKKKSDLVVIIDQLLETKALEESYTAKLPIISLNNDLDIFDDKSNYKVPGNFVSSKSKINNNLFYSILITTMKKSHIIKKKFPALHHKLKTINVLKKKHYKKKNYRKNK